MARSPCSCCGTPSTPAELRPVCAVCLEHLMGPPGAEAPAIKRRIPMLDVNQAALVLGVSSKTLRRYIHVGDLPALDASTGRRRHGARWRIRWPDLQRFQAARRHRPR
jgi:hypothetical protein